MMAIADLIAAAAIRQGLGFCSCLTSTPVALTLLERMELERTAGLAPQTEPALVLAPVRHVEDPVVMVLKVA